MLCEMAAFWDNAVLCGRVGMSPLLIRQLSIVMTGYYDGVPWQVSVPMMARSHEFLLA